MNKMNFKKSFGLRVRYLRKMAALSQEQLAEITGLSAKTISYIENGKNTISFNRLPLLAKGLGVPVYKLFVLSDEEVKSDELYFYIKSATNKEINAITEVVKTILSLK